MQVAPEATDNTSSIPPTSRHAGTGSHGRVGSNECFACIRTSRRVLGSEEERDAFSAAAFHAGMERC